MLVTRTFSPTAADTELQLGVENFDGQFGWPVWGATDEEPLATRPTPRT